MTASNSGFLPDTNILVRSVNAGDPNHQVAVNAIEKLLNDNHDVYLIPQNIVEFWNVSTRPADKNGLGLTVKETLAHVAAFESIFTVLPENELIFSQWKFLVETHQVKGVKVHDARIAASVQVHNVAHLLTFNGGDFKRFADFTVVHPNDV